MEREEKESIQFNICCFLAKEKAVESNLGLSHSNRQFFKNFPKAICYIDGFHFYFYKFLSKPCSFDCSLTVLPILKSELFVRNYYVSHIL